MASPEKIVDLCRDILPIPSVHLSKEALYTLLDELILELDEQEVDSVIQSLQAEIAHEALLLDRAEYEFVREMLLAHQIIEAKDLSPLINFRSTSWYKEAHLFENEALAEHPMNNILMIGSGPYPSTVFSLMETWDQSSVTCIDNSEVACNLSRRVASIAGHGRFCIKHETASMYPLHHFDCVIVGTLVGVRKEEKHTILESIISRLPPGTALAVRTATGPGRIIYPTVDLKQFQGFRYRVLENPPQRTWTTIINPPKLDFLP